jgi:hypothetical protein
MKYKRQMQEKEKAQKRNAEIRKYKAEHPALSGYDIAKVFKVTSTTVYNALKAKDNDN